MEESSYHVPVLLDETIDALVTTPSGSYADLTLGGGGHSSAILARLDEGGRLFAFDADPGAIEHARRRFADLPAERLRIEQAYFSEACDLLEEEGVLLDGALLDLGVSSRQLDSDQIGLSHRQTMPLDMRFRRDEERSSAAELVNDLPAGDLATLLRRYGEEPAAWKIATGIERARRAAPLRTTTDLREVIAGLIPAPFLNKTLARVFQALRIAVNDELGELERGLDSLIPLLRQGGRLALLTYHSLEDRIVKEKIRFEERDCVCPPELPLCQCDKRRRLRAVGRKPIVPGPEEVARNPRARSARLRVAERVDEKRVPTARGGR